MSRARRVEAGRGRPGARPAAGPVRPPSAQRSSRRRAALWAAGPLALLAAWGGPAAAQGYTITDLGVMDGVSSSARAINNRGQVIGTIDFAGNTTWHPFLWQNGVMTNLGSLGGSQSTAEALNNAGQIVGSSTLADDKTTHAFLWQNGAMQDLGTLGGSSSYASGINATGRVTGSSQIAGSSDEHAFLWQSGAMTDLDVTGSSTSQAVGINAAGQVAGEFQSVEGFLWQDGVTRNLGTLGSRLCLPTALNDQGQVVGISGVPGGTEQDIAHAFLADGNGIHDLGSLGGTWSYAFALNNSGDVVGYSTGSGFQDYHAFLYSGGVMQDLNALIPADSGWRLRGAYGINDYGQIVGAGYHNGLPRAFLLNPPAPAAPDGLTARVISGTQVNLAWTDNSSDETGFEIWRQTGSGDFTLLTALAPNTTGYTDSGLTPHTAYTYQVRALGLGGASAWSGDAAAVTAPPALAPPAFLSVRMGKEGAALLSWTDPPAPRVPGDNEYAFAIWREGGGAGWARVGVVPPNTTTFTDTGLAPSATYTYRVRATNSVASDWSNTAALATPARPAAPTALTIGATGAKVVLLGWSVQAADETGITIWRQAGSGDWAPVGVVPPGATYYFDTSVSPGTTYTYRLRAHNNDYASDWSNTVSATTPSLPTAP